MTIIWLIVWLIQGAPQVAQWNTWMVALMVCIVLDVLGLIAKEG